MSMQLNAPQTGSFGVLPNFCWIRIDENTHGVSSRRERVDNSAGDGWLDVARTLPIKIKPNHVGAEFNARVRIIRVCDTTDFDLCFCRHQTCRASVSGVTVACLRRS